MMDGAPTPCGIVQSAVQSGNAALCPNDDCNGLRYVAGGNGVGEFQRWAPHGVKSSGDTFVTGNGSWRLVGYVGDTSGSGLLSNFFSGDMLSTSWKSLRDEGGCNRLMASVFAGDFVPFPVDETPGVTDLAEAAPKLAGAAGMARALAYGAGKGLSVPMRSSVFRGLRAEALELNVAAEEVIAPAQVIYGSAHALIKTVGAAASGECH